MLVFLTSGTPLAVFTLSVAAICAVAVLLSLATWLGSITARRRSGAPKPPGGCGDMCHCMRIMAGRHERLETADTDKTCKSENPA